MEEFETFELILAFKMNLFRLKCSDLFWDGEDGFGVQKRMMILEPHGILGSMCGCEFMVCRAINVCPCGVSIRQVRVVVRVALRLQFSVFKL